MSPPQLYKTVVKGLQNHLYEGNVGIALMQSLQLYACKNDPKQLWDQTQTKLSYFALQSGTMPSPMGSAWMCHLSQTVKKYQEEVKRLPKRQCC